MSGDENKAAQVELDESIELELIPEDGGNAEAGRFRVGLAMVLTMIAEIAEDQAGKAIPAGVLNGLAADIIHGDVKGVSFVNAHVGRMMNVRLVPMAPEGSE